MVANVHIEYSTHQFSEESMRYRKKRGPERVKKQNSEWRRGVGVGHYLYKRTYRGALKNAGWSHKNLMGGGERNLGANFFCHFLFFYG